VPTVDQALSWMREVLEDHERIAAQIPGAFSQMPLGAFRFAT
jgi:hypothetical protein